MTATSPLGCHFGRKFPASLLLLPPGRSFIRWCIRWQSLVSALCSSVWHFKLFISSISQCWLGAGGTTKDPDPELRDWGTDQGVGCSSCLAAKMLKRSTLGGLSSHFLEAWTSRTKDRPRGQGVSGGLSSQASVHWEKDRNFIIWDYESPCSPYQLNPFPPWLPVSQVMENFLLWILLHHGGCKNEQIFISKPWWMVKICVM